MRHLLRTSALLARLIIDCARGIPDYLIHRADQFVHRQQTIDTLRTVAGKDAATVYLYATGGDADTALDIAKLGLDPVAAFDLAEAGASPRALLAVATAEAGIPPTSIDPRDLP